MFSDITIMIPTLGRLNKQQTLDILPDNLKERTKLVVDYTEFDDHDMEYADQCEVISTPEGMSGIAAVRQWCLENCDTPYLFLLDDDMVFCKRTGEGVKLAQCTNDEIEQMFAELTDWMDFEGFPVVGVSARQGNNHVEDRFREITRQMNFHGVDVKKFHELGLRFDGSEVMEDFHMLLTMFTQGIPNRVFYEYCWNQIGSGAAGGCSTYRDAELQGKCAEALKEAFPDFVAVVEKKAKSTWKGMETRKDVRVQWKKAFESYDGGSE